MINIFKILKLYRSSNIGPVNFFYLLNKFLTIDGVFENLPFLEDKWKKKIKFVSDDFVKSEIETTQKIGAKFITFLDEEYPKSFKNNREMPPILIALGKKELLNSNLISIVGTRIPSANGLKFCSYITRELVDHNFVTVSGFAKGIDTCVHENSLKTGTIGVLAGGINIIYPSENSRLYHQIKSENLFITDQPFGLQPSSKFFPKRNSLIAGLGRATLVIESMKDSGALITAEKCKKYQKTVFAVPGHPFDMKYYGNNELLKNGGILVTNIKDILDGLSSVVSDESEDFLSFCDFEEGETKEVFDLLNYAPISIEEVASILKLPINKVLSILIEMEIMGLVCIEANKVTKISDIKDNF